MKKIAILGTVGIPANYGGFETLVENLVSYNYSTERPSEMVVYCSTKSYSVRPDSYLGAELRYVRLSANGVSSIPYDIFTLFSAVWQRSDVILLLGVSGAIVLPLLRLLSRTRIVTNIDGLEWKRKKWKGLARLFLSFSERVAVKFSHEVIADNKAIADYVARRYKRDCSVIAYGGDHAVQAPAKDYEELQSLDRYALALCRIEPENNATLILKVFARKPEIPLIFIGNWYKSAYGRKLKRRYASFQNLHLLDSIYDRGILRTIRSNAHFYVHGHSAGGTNPSLVEMMHFGKPVLAFDCNFNRYTTDGKATYFKDAAELNNAIETHWRDDMTRIGHDMRSIAQQRYTWDGVGRAYCQILLGVNET